MIDFRYSPFEEGYSTAPGLHRLGTDFGHGKGDEMLFQIDPHYQRYITNKDQCRQEGMQKYFQVKQPVLASEKNIARFIMNMLVIHYPQYFSLQKKQHTTCFHNTLTGKHFSFDQESHTVEGEIFGSLLDALISQLQEDIAIWQVGDGQDYLSHIHLCAPNHWSPEEKIGQSFSAVHAPVADMGKIKHRYQPMMRSLTRHDSFVRFAWGIGTDDRLNHHPVPPDEVSSELWEGRSFSKDHPELFIRTERQTLTGFPEQQAILFTIKTYFTAIRDLQPVQIQALIQAIQSMSKDTLVYKGLEDDKEAILQWLKQLGS